MSAIKNGDVYVFSTSNYTPTKITNFGNITKVYEGCYCENGYRCGIFWTGSVTEDAHSVYTIASPAVGFNTYSNTNLQQLGISTDSSKQLMSMSDFLQCFTE